MDHSIMSQLSQLSQLSRKVTENHRIVTDVEILVTGCHSLLGFQDKSKVNKRLISLSLQIIKTIIILGFHLKIKCHVLIDNVVILFTTYYSALEGAQKRYAPGRNYE
jgi:hypothetical protein